MVCELCLNKIVNLKKNKEKIRELKGKRRKGLNVSLKHGGPSDCGEKAG